MTVRRSSALENSNLRSSVLDEQEFLAGWLEGERKAKKFHKEWAVGHKDRMRRIRAAERGEGGFFDGSSIWDLMK